MAQNRGDKYRMSAAVGNIVTQRNTVSVPSMVSFKIHIFLLTLAFVTKGERIPAYEDSRYMELKEIQNMKWSISMWFDYPEILQGYKNFTLSGALWGLNEDEQKLVPPSAKMEIPAYVRGHKYGGAPLLNPSLAPLFEGNDRLYITTLRHSNDKGCPMMHGYDSYSSRKLFNEIVVALLDGENDLNVLDTAVIDIPEGLFTAYYYNYTRHLSKFMFDVVDGPMDARIVNKGDTYWITFFHERNIEHDVTARTIAIARVHIEVATCEEKFEMCTEDYEEGKLTDLSDADAEPWAEDHISMNKCEGALLEMILETKETCERKCASEFFERFIVNFNMESGFCVCKKCDNLEAFLPSSKQKASGWATKVFPNSMSEPSRGRNGLVCKKYSHGMYGPLKPNAKMCLGRALVVKNEVVFMPHSPQEGLEKNWNVNQYFAVR